MGRQIFCTRAGVVIARGILFIARPVQNSIICISPNSTALVEVALDLTVPLAT
jgi:hypothetical protein